MGLSEDTQKTIRAVGRIIAATSAFRKSLVYRLEKVRTKADLLNVLSEASKGFYAVRDNIKEEDRKYLNPLSIDNLAAILNDENLDRKKFQVIKDTLMINSFVSLTKNTKSEEEK